MVNKKLARFVKEFEELVVQCYFLILSFSCFIAGGLFGFFFLTNSFFIEQFSSVMAVILWVGCVTFGYLSFLPHHDKKKLGEVF